MGGTEKIENGQRKKCLETAIPITLQAFNASKDKDCDPWILQIHSNYRSHLRAKRFYKDSRKYITSVKYLQ